MTGAALIAVAKQAGMGGVDTRSLIHQFLTCSAASDTDSCMSLLQALSRNFTKSMSKTEFDSLLAFAVHQAEIDCPCWRPMARSESGDQEYEKLRQCLAAYDVTQASALIAHFWEALVNQMTVLIGENLTTLTFRRALVPILAPLLDARGPAGADAHGAS